MKNTSAFAKILEAANKMKNNGGGNTRADADKYWLAETDKAGNGYAIIRFLPGKTDDDAPFNKIYNHGFKNTMGKWFIENCPTTIGGDCPVCEANGVLWNSGNEKDKDVVRERKRKLSFVTNILVVEDKKNPDNEGKVFIFKFGKKIFDKITEAMQPPVDEKGQLIDPDLPAINPFDTEEGANFKLKIRKVEGYANFDKSSFENISELKKWDELSEQLHDLSTITTPEMFKTYEELDKRLKQHLGGIQRPVVREKPDDDTDDDDGSRESARDDCEAENGDKKPAVKTETKVDDDDDMAYFRNLAGE